MKFSYLVEVAFYIPLLPALLAILKWKNMKVHEQWFGALLWAIVLISFSGELWFKLEKGSNMPFFHIYILVEYLILLQVFRHMFGTGIRSGIWLILGIGFSITWLVNIFAGEGWWGFPDYIHALEAIVILVLTVAWYLKMLREKTISRPAKTFEFWMCSGLLIFFSGSFLLFLFPKFLISAGNEVFNAIWIMNCILIIITYTLYSVALIWVRRAVK